MFGPEYIESNEKQKSEIDERVNYYFSLLNKELDISENTSRLKDLSYNYIYGTDANPRMARTAKMNMIMHGDGHGGVYHHDGLLNVNDIFENRFDVILTNPPFGSRIEKSLKISETDKFTDELKIKHYTDLYGEAYTKALSQVNNNIGKSMLNLYTSGKSSTLTEVLFIERCFNLLKPGGRLGIVLPEGVLNNTNLQTVRELFEGMGKIVLITSIPQDVFMASGATIKPSLMFFKKFTEVEKLRYSRISKVVKGRLRQKYNDEIVKLQNIINDKALKRTEHTLAQKELQNIEKKIIEESKPLIKKRFDYLIPIAHVEKAGITTTGAPCENELKDLLKEYNPYRHANKLWTSIQKIYDYKIDNDKLYRKLNNGEWEEL